METITFGLKEHAHRRLNTLTGEWVQVSPHRAKRPWHGQIASVYSQEDPVTTPSVICTLPIQRPVALKKLSDIYHTQ